MAHFLHLPLNKKMKSNINNFYFLSMTKTIV